MDSVDIMNDHSPLTSTTTHANLLLKIFDSTECGLDCTNPSCIFARALEDFLYAGAISLVTVSCRTMRIRTARLSYRRQVAHIFWHAGVHSVCATWAKGHPFALEAFATLLLARIAHVSFGVYTFPF